MTVRFFIHPIVDRFYFWLLEIGQIKVGLHPAEGWLLSMGNRIVYLSDTESFMPLLPLLEIDREYFLESLHRASLVCVELNTLDFSLQERLLIRYALTSSVSEYWPNKALAWVRSQPEMVDDLRQDLEAAIKKPWASQSFKHQVRKVLKNVAN